LIAVSCRCCILIPRPIPVVDRRLHVNDDTIGKPKSNSRFTLHSHQRLQSKLSMNQLLASEPVHASHQIFHGEGAENKIFVGGGGCSNRVFVEHVACGDCDSVCVGVARSMDGTQGDYIADDIAGNISKKPRQRLYIWGDVDISTDRLGGTDGRSNGRSLSSIKSNFRLEPTEVQLEKFTSQSITEVAFLIGIILSR
jgi:hypothetical protein